MPQGADVMVGDRERCGGFYILGQPRTGKSNLLISMALSDIEKGTSILFIDPHTDALNDLLSRIPRERRKSIILLDPTEKGRSFGINLLHCADRTNPLALDETWGRIRDVFVKVWGDENGQLGFWFDKILRDSVYLLLENPDYTLVEVPLLLREDTTFRNSLIEKVRVKPLSGIFGLTSLTGYRGGTRQSRLGRRSIDLAFFAISISFGTLLVRHDRALTFASYYRAIPKGLSCFACLQTLQAMLNT